MHDIMLKSRTTIVAISQKCNVPTFNQLNIELYSMEVSFSLWVYI